MCSPDNAQAIRSIVIEKVDAVEQFTAFDVTQVGFNRQSTTERHGHLKHGVHALWNDGTLTNAGYHRTRVALDGVAVDPILYYPGGTDPQDYIDAYTAANPDAGAITDDDGDARIAPPGDTDTATATAVAPSVVSTQTDKDVHSTTRTGRLNIPKVALDQVFSPGQVVSVVHDGSKIILTPTCPRIGASFSTQSINASGEVRLSPKTLSKISTSTRFKVAASNGQIVIEEG